MSTECATTYECGICLESYDASANITRMPCGHTGCFACITKVVRGENTTCPYCRADLIEREEEDDEEELGSEDSYSSGEDEYDDEEDKYPIERLCEAFEQKGYTLKDALRIIFGRVKTDELEEFARMQDDLDEMDDRLQGEYEQELRQRQEAEPELAPEAQEEKIME